ncbi:hypothetical protein [Turneriella parva]|uniref:Uncharacterized protein n=1 Tax=Turneriella parva (strain ATCC BAA-1111 / DSM 21527 / NCTC 11395 / H) TaxID=869212 RepID=I4B9K2_TURPD|nr:hypothetical protein [Turneriella parva]AFM13959.1 hypothetical protein Turpa_3321 [Turneriella parva DSM 21527]
MKLKPTVLVLFVQIFLASSLVFAETAKEPKIQYVGSFGSDIQIHGESVFEVILEKMLDAKKLAKIAPYKPKKDNENGILDEINKELIEYNLSFGDLFVGKFEIEKRNIIALILVYGDLAPRIRYYHVRGKK